MEALYPATDLVSYCKSCRLKGGCDACPRPQLLPECVPATWAYDVCATQWRTGFAGATGLDYDACVATLQLYLPRWQADAPPTAPIHAMQVLDLLDDLRTIEHALLTAWKEKADESRPTHPASDE